ncbi:MAG: ACT domain-containing protein [Geminicoccaceae bacterium]
MTALTLTLIGPDRPGLVQAVSDRIAAVGGNWTESRMARLAGQFAGILLIDVPDAEIDALVRDLQDLETEGLRVSIASGTAEQVQKQRGMTLELIGHDHPGIVRDISQVLAARGVNIEELTTSLESASFAGETMFKAVVRLSAPNDLEAHELRHALETIANDLMVDITLDGAAR